jgi:hypothetical protein
MVAASLDGFIILVIGSTKKRVKTMTQVPEQQQGVPLPPPPPGGLSIPPVTPVPVSARPEPAHGDICNFMMALYGQDLARFVTMVQTDLRRMALYGQDLARFVTMVYVANQ